MQYVLVLFFTLFSLHCTSQSIENVRTYYDLGRTMIKETYSVLVNEPTLKHGLYRKFDKRGIKALEIPFRNGKVHGLAKEYYLPLFGKAGDGRVKIETPYINDKKQGIAKNYVYLKNGKMDLPDGEPFLSLEQYYENDIIIREVKYYTTGQKEYDSYFIDGKTTKWYENGQKQEEFELSNGKINGPYTFWYENGQVGKAGSVKHGIEDGKWTHYAENGRKEKEEHYQNGELVKSIDYYKSGVWEKRQLLPNGNYIFTQFLANGQKSFEAEVLKTDYLGGKLNYCGGYTSWYENGNIKANGQFIRPGNRSKKEGYWIFFTQQGDTLSHGMYKDNYHIGKWKIFYDEEWKEVHNIEDAAYYRKIEFDKSGAPLGTVYDYYISGQLQWEGKLFSINPDIQHGHCIGYYPSGKKEFEANFNRGVPFGKIKRWDENGNLEVE